MAGRMEIGIDSNKITAQLNQINSLIEQNYKKSIQGQQEYNKVLEKSISLLNQQANLVGQLGQQNQLPESNNNSQSSNFVGSGNNLSELNKLVEDILDVITSIWQKFSQINTLGGNSSISGENSLNPSNGINNDIDLPDDNTSNNDSSSSVNNTEPQPIIRDSSSSDGNKVTDAARTVSNLAATGASDPNYIVAGIAGMIPVIGAGLSSIVGKMINEAEQRTRARSYFRSATGGNYDFISLQGLGYKNAEAYQKEAQYYPSNINLSLRDFQFEKGFGVSGGTMTSLLRAMRGDLVQQNFGISSSELGLNYLNSLNSTGGIDSKKVRGYTEDYLKILVDLNQQQLEMTGETNSLINSEIVAGIAKTSEKFSDPTVLGRVVQSLKSGLTQAPSAQAEALQYWALSQANPNADIWEMQLMREDPFSERSRGYFSNYLNSLLQTGNKNDVRFNVMNAFGLSAAQTEEFLNGIEKARNSNPNFNLTNYLEGADLTGLFSENSSLKLPGVNEQIKNAAAAATSPNEVLLAKAADRLADVGEPILKFTNTAIEKTGEAIDLMSKFFEGGLKETLKEVLKDFGKDILDFLSPFSSVKTPTLPSNSPSPNNRPTGRAVR